MASSWADLWRDEKKDVAKGNLVAWLRAEKELVNLLYGPWLGRSSHEKAKQAIVRRLRASGKPWLMTKTWWRGRRDFEVDYELRAEWLVALNDCAKACGVKVNGVCAGHPHGVSGFGQFIFPGLLSPGVVLGCRSLRAASRLACALDIPHTEIGIKVYRIKSRRRGGTESYMCVLGVDANFRHSGKNQRALARWWKTILAAFEKFARRKR